MSRALPFVMSILLVVPLGVPAADLPRVEPEAVGLSEKTLDEVQHDGHVVPASRGQA
jgi:hypothetical protein